MRPSDKLDYKRFRSFIIKRNIKNVSFKLKLSSTIKIYLIFHISLLEPALPDILERPVPEIYLDTQEEEFEVERILNVRIHRRRLQ
jgi:hypothetical protein